MRKALLALSYFIFLFTVLFSTSCATIQEKNESTVRDVVEKYWRMRLEDNYRESYKSEHKEVLPSFDIYKDKAAAIKKITIMSYKIKDVRIEGEKAIIDIEFSLLLPVTTKPVRQILSDEWLYRDGRWWHVFPR